MDDSREGIERYLKRNLNTCFAAVQDGRIIGVILTGHDGRRGIIHHMCVHPEFMMTIVTASTTTWFSSLCDETVKAAPDVVISEGVERAEGNAFSDTKIRVLSIPSTLTQFETNSFRDEIMQIKVSAKNPALGFKNGFLFDKTNGLMYWYSSLSNQKAVFSYCVNCGNAVSNAKVKLSLDFKGNLIFSKYGVKVFVDDVFYVDLDHGVKKDLECRLSTGKHKVKLQKIDDSTVFSETEIDINRASNVVIKFETNKNGIKINDNQISGYISSNYVVEFGKSEMHYEDVLKLNCISHSFTWTDIVKTMKQSRRGYSSVYGSYIIDKDGFLILSHDGIQEKLYYEVVPGEFDSNEVLYPVGENDQIKRGGKMGKDYLKRKD